MFGDRERVVAVGLSLIVLLRVVNYRFAGARTSRELNLALEQRLGLVSIA